MCIGIILKFNGSILKIGMITATFQTFKAIKKALNVVTERLIALDGRCQAIEAGGSNLSQILALIDPSNKNIGVWLPWSRCPTSPWIQASEGIMLAVLIAMLYCIENLWISQRILRQKNHWHPVFARKFTKAVVASSWVGFYLWGVQTSKITCVGSNAEWSFIQQSHRFLENKNPMLSDQVSNIILEFDAWSNHTQLNSDVWIP